jgi:tetratricopeptide (TPR) repeat protein
MTEVADRISKGFDDSILPMPQYTKYKNMGNEALVLYGTMQSFYDIVNKSEYQQYTADDTAMYNSIMKELDALIGTTLEIQTVDGKLKEVTHNEAMIYFCQYMFAYTSGKTYEAQEYLAKVYETEPDYLWLYAYEYALSSIGAGDIETAEKLAGALIEADRQDVDGYSLYSTIARLSGDADKAIEWTDKALEFDPENAELLRLKAIALVVKGDPEQAKEVIDEALTYESYGILYYTSIVIENELGNTETVEETVSMLQSYGLEVSDRVNSYLAGKITAEQLFTEGTGDVE